MNQPQQVDERMIEELKRKREIDKQIARSTKSPEHKIEKELDPRLVRLILKFLKRKA